MRSWFAAIAAVLVVLVSGPAGAEKRIALVIGNNDYPFLHSGQQLSKAVNDAVSVGDALERIGFTVIRGTNLDRKGMVDRIFAFTSQISEGDMALVFFAGHGVSFAGGNYLLPADVPPMRPGEESRLRNLGIGEADVIADIQEKKARVAVMLIDACRDNPFRQPGLLRSLGNARGLAPAREASGVFAVYSAGFGQSALDSLGPSDPAANSVFTRVLLPALARGDTHLTDIIIDMRQEVARLARTIGHEQTPAYYDQTTGGRVYLAARQPDANPGAQPVPSPGPPGLAGDDIFWSAIRDSTLPRQFEEFLTRFPTSRHAEAARQRLEELRRGQSAVVSPPGAITVPPGSRYGNQRNPFGVDDVVDPLGSDVREFAARTRLPGGPRDRNAEQWAPTPISGKPGSLEGDWLGRWKPGSSGGARVRVYGDRVFILYADTVGDFSGRTWILEAAREGAKLVGRWVQVGNPRDTGPFVGLIVDDERIDGIWSWSGTGRWDFRRKLRR